MLNLQNVFSEKNLESRLTNHQGEEAMATHSSILAWRTPWTEVPGRLYSPWGLKKLDTTEAA